MRSSSIVSFFKEFSMPIVKLKEGYKGYRRFLNRRLPELVKEKKFIALYGKTGSGKTDILKNISKRGFDVLDLEACANHRGSLLGGIGLGERVTQKNFEAEVLELLLFSSSETVFVEGESKRIGNIVMPGYLYEKLLNARKFLIETKLAKRLEIIKREYIKEDYSESEIIASIEKLGKYIGEKKVIKYIEDISNKEFDSVIRDLIENYYDKAYKTKSHTFERTFYNEDEDRCAEEILKYINS